MDRTAYSVAIAPGDGLIARFGDVVMYVAGAAGSATSDPDASVAAGHLIAAVESAAGASDPAAAVANRLAALAFGGAQTPPFGVVAPLPDGLLVLLRGTVAAEIIGADGARVLSGHRALTWVDEVLPSSTTRVAIGVPGMSGESGWPQTDLRAGVVPGGGFVLRRAAPAGLTVSSAPGSSALVEQPTRKQPQTTVHHGPPALVSDDGAIYPLDRPYVLGRAPQEADAVRAAIATPIPLANDQHISRVHAYVAIDDGTVYVRDAATPGGTYIAAQGTGEWTQVGTAPTELKPGWSLRIGERILTYPG